VSLPRGELLAGSCDPSALGDLIDRAERTLRTWTPSVSGFLPAPVWREAEARLGRLTELSVRTAGGIGRAERRRVLLARAEGEGRQVPEDSQAGCHGLTVHGNFLFDPVTADELRTSLHGMGAAPGELGDLWLCGDRGGQLVCTPAAAERLGGCRGQLREVTLQLEATPLELLRPPQRRAPATLTRIEASCRLDAVASAGFGLSRSRTAALIRQGAMRVNWLECRQPSRVLQAGDTLQLEGRGEVTVQEVLPTKRQRWRLSLHRR
jgi:photosystem II S4 domain protein